jgi:hypothetical protein
MPRLLLSLLLTLAALPRVASIAPLPNPYLSEQPLRGNRIEQRTIAGGLPNTRSDSASHLTTWTERQFRYAGSDPVGAASTTQNLPARVRVSQGRGNAHEHRTQCEPAILTVRE